MFFTHCSTVAGYLLLVSGTIWIALGAFFGADEAVASMFGTKTPSEAINEGIYVALMGIVLGVLAEISRAIRSN